MALIGMCCFDTIENNRTKLTEQTLDCLMLTVDFNKHRLIVVDNNSCQETKDALYYCKKDLIPLMEIITLDKNIGTAKAINMAWSKRAAGEHLVKMDNDVDILSYSWMDKLEEAIERAPDQLGILGLKRKDLEEHPNHESDIYKSEMWMLPHAPGQRWLCVEKVDHVLGTCQMYNYRLIDKIGGLCQMEGLYGFDDAIGCARAHKAGYITAFLNGVEIDHLDNGGTAYTQWKADYAGEMFERFIQYKTGYMDGTRDIYVPL